MLAHSPKNRSRSPSHDSNETSLNTIESISNNKTKKETETQQRLKNLKTFIQALINDSSSIGTSYDEQVKVLESACIEQYRDLPHDRIRRMIRSVLKVRKSHPPTTTSNSFLHQEHTNMINDRFNSNGNHNNNNNTKKNRSNSITNNPPSTTKASDLIPSSPTSGLSTFDADFLRHAFSQQFRPSLDLSAYFSTASNGNNPASSLFRPNFPPSNFLQALTSTTPLVPPPLISSHPNGIPDSPTIKSSKQTKISNTETNSIKVLVNAYREAASYLSRSADELEQLI